MLNQEINQTQAVLDGGFAHLRFPAELEQDFVASFQRLAVAILRNNIKYIFFVYVFLGAGIALVLPKESLDVWPVSHAILGAIILTASTACSFHKLDAYQQHYTSFFACIGVAQTMIAPYYFGDNTVAQIAQMGTLYGILVVYTSVGLRFKAATLTCWSGGALALLYMQLQDIQINWLFFHESFIGANILGMVLAYLAEHRSRMVFLQSRLLKLEKQKSDEMAEKMEQMTREDALTGLANRRHFDSVYAMEWARAVRYSSSVAIMFIDIDHFKKYNDYYGHQKGDDCIQQVARILGDQTKRAGELAARFGGEEFVVIFPQTSVASLQMIAQRTLECVREANIPHARSDIANQVTVSVGVAFCVPGESTQPESLLKQADMALYKAKQNGRNNWVYLEGLSDRESTVSSL